MGTLLRRIRVNNLYGTSKCIDANLQDNTLVIVGENGSGKTTFLRIVYNVLAGRWRSLAMFRFDSVILTFDDDEIEITDSIIKIQRDLSSKKLLRFPSAVRQAILEAFDLELPNKESLARISDKYGIPVRILIEELNSFEEDSNLFSKDAKNKLKIIHEKINAQILYLPTYRRIERELSSIVDWIDPNDLIRSRRRNRSARRERTNSYIELVEFGMQDVEDYRDAELDRLEKLQSESLNVLTLKHFGDIVSSAYKIDDIKRLATISEAEIKSSLDRVDESIVGRQQRNDWLKAITAARSSKEPTERDQIICHYFLKIFDFQKRLQTEEERISSFCRICSEYITDKDFIYDSTSFKLSIRPRHATSPKEPVELSDLSSGEKQIVSLFSHLYLSGQNKYFVLIDEPELSLSVPWQKRFLVDVHSGSFCAGLIAVTHSPFIYDNELKKYAHSLGEFAR
jgi:energy-coupling factor transporter ATP-binding protein EcfA2